MGSRVESEIVFENAARLIAWYHRRVEQFVTGELVSHSSTEDGIRIKCCRTLHSMKLVIGKKEYEFNVPASVFFSTASAEEWVAAEIQRQDELLAQQQEEERARQQILDRERDLTKLRRLMEAYPEEARALTAEPELVNVVVDTEPQPEVASILSDSKPQPDGEQAAA